MGIPENSENEQGIDMQQDQEGDVTAALNDRAGDLTVKNNVIAAIVGHAANTVEGVNRLGNTGGLLRAVADTVRSASGARGTGVDVEASANAAIIDLELVVDYGYPVMPLVKEVRTKVEQDLEQYLHLKVKEVNIIVVDIEFPEAGTRRTMELSTAPVPPRTVT